MSLPVILFSIFFSLLVFVGGAFLCWMLIKVILRNLWQIELPLLPRIKFKKSNKPMPMRPKKFANQGITEIEQLLEEEAKKTGGQE